MATYDEAMAVLRESSGTIDDVISAIHWGLSVDEYEGQYEPKHRDLPLAQSVYQALNAAGFRVVKV